MSGNVPTDPKRAARRAGLRYMPDTVPGISRHGRPGHFTYVMPSGKRVRDATVLKRIAKMAIPRGTSMQDAGAQFQGITALEFQAKLLSKGEGVARASA